MAMFCFSYAKVFLFSLPSFLLQNNTCDVYWEQCFQMSPHTKTFYAFNSWFSIGCSCPLQECVQPWMQRRNQSCIWHQNVSSNHGTRQRSEPGVGKAGWYSPVSPLGWSESMYSQSHSLHELHPCLWYCSCYEFHRPYLLRTNLLHSQCQVFPFSLKICACAQE